MALTVRVREPVSPSARKARPRRMRSSPANCAVRFTVGPSSGQASPRQPSSKLQNPSCASAACPPLHPQCTAVPRTGRIGSCRPAWAGRGPEGGVQAGAFRVVTGLLQRGLAGRCRERRRHADIPLVPRRGPVTSNGPSLYRQPRAEVVRRESHQGSKRTLSMRRMVRPVRPSPSAVRSESSMVQHSPCSPLQVCILT